jgi:hypothetical protein
MEIPIKSASMIQPIPEPATGGSDLSLAGGGLLQRFIFTPFIIVNDASWVILHWKSPNEISQQATRKG